MDRRNNLTMKKIIIIAFCIIMFSCTSKIRQNDIVGEWKSIDSTILKINSDSTFDIINIPEQLLINHNSTKRVSVSGIWEIGYVDGNVVTLIIQKNHIYSNCVFILSIDRDYCLSKSCWKLNFILNIEDNEIKYEFIRSR